ncbi:disintegrin and metalloproteinase domain-containing protein 28-like isoform X2 [Artemia franciscana]|uniref:disintegrin and metalloproteinase domain-containing protein 28-like isoform X2 n=1 Tax=Artemia franciscana TaxID=6661 RepID=UPI0032D9E7D6
MKYIFPMWLSILFIVNFLGLNSKGNQERELVETSCSARDAECCYDLQEESGLIPFKNHSIAESNTTQYFSDTSHKANQELYRSARSVVYPFYGRKEIRVVELVLVVDGTLLKNYASDSRKIEAKFLEILSYVNFLYFQFHVRVALVGIDFWFYGDKIKISKDADFNLRGFNLYRKIELPKKFKYDHALLLSGIEFGSELGVVLGRAYTGTICGEDSTSVMSYNDNIPKLAWTIAHEMGHSFGMRHDDSTCYCRPGHICIMATHFSTYSYCGNYVLDPGEECDCGLPEYCLNSCCDPLTCKLKGTAICSNGECCNQKTCTLKPKRTVCRRKTSECDLPETCDGYSEFCPPNKYQPDGKPCRNGEVFCVKGVCPPPIYQQCRIIWGDEFSRIEYGCYRANSQTGSGSRRRPVGYL